jgi:bifunctional non-homologous end joining protein LigD
VYVFDLLHLNGRDLRHVPLTDRLRRMERLLIGAGVLCPQPIEAFDDSQRLLEVAERHKLEGRGEQSSQCTYRSGECPDWRKVKTSAWRVANKERWRLFEK